MRLKIQTTFWHRLKPNTNLVAFYCIAHKGTFQTSKSIINWSRHLWSDSKQRCHLNPFKAKMSTRVPFTQFFFYETSPFFMPPLKINQRKVIENTWGLLRSSHQCFFQKSMKLPFLPPFFIGLLSQ